MEANWNGKCLAGYIISQWQELAGGGEQGEMQTGCWNLPVQRLVGLLLQGLAPPVLICSDEHMSQALLKRTQPISLTPPSRVLTSWPNPKHSSS